MKASGEQDRSRIPAELAAVLRATAEKSEEVLAFFDATAASALAGNVDRVHDQATAGRWALMELRTRLDKAKMLLAAATMVGEVEKPVMAMDLELHPVNRTDEKQRELALMRESLHRAGDHTLDPEPEEVGA